jgi:VCBS repeat-containing protein
MNLWTHAITRLFRRPAAVSKSASRTPRLTGSLPRFRPSVSQLEERTVPSGSDFFASATALTGLFATSSGSNVGATAELGEPSDFGDGSVNSIWWQWTAPSTGIVEVNTLGSTDLAGRDLDTTLAVYTGSAVDALTLVDLNDDYYGFQSRVQFKAVAGTTYHFAADGYDTAVGNIALTLGVLPRNDNFASAATFTGSIATGGSFGATGEVGEPNPLGDPTVSSVWWQWTATVSGPVDLNTDGSTYDTTLAVFTGSTLGTLTLVAANDDAAGFGLQSAVQFTAVAGTTYHFAVDGFKEAAGGVVLNMNNVSSNKSPVIANQSFTVAENSPLTAAVGTVQASDPDGNALTYAITGGNPAGAFVIDAATGLLRVNNPAALNYESSSALSLTVQVTDNGSPALSSAATIIVNLTDANDAPAFGPVASYTVNENSAATTAVGSAAATDPDAGQTLTYAIVDGNTGGAFAIDAQGNITVANAAALNFESLSSFTLTVQATDNGLSPQHTTTCVTVTVNDVNEVPVTANQQFTAKSDDAAGTVVGTVPGSDQDHGQTLSYAIASGNDTGAFAINGATGQITIVNAAALGSATTANLTVRVTDNGSPSLFATADVTVTVTQVFVPPPVVLTAPQQVTALTTSVQTLATSSTIDKGTCNALQSSLNTALAKLQQGNTNAAVNTLNAFIGKVQDAIKAGKLSAAAGQSLINAANAAIFSATH